MAQFAQRLGVREPSTRSLFIQGNDLLLDAGLVSKLPTIRYWLATLAVTLDESQKNPILELEGEAEADNGRERTKTLWKHEEALRIAKVSRDRAAQAREANGASPLPLPPQTVALVGGCSLVGGYGFDGRLQVGSVNALRFREDGLWITDQNSSAPAMAIPLSALRTLEFTGPGRVTKGGGFFGGGFGLVGAAEGMIVGSVLNALTTRTSIHTMIRCEATDAELFFFNGQETPDALRMRLSGVLAMIRRQRDAPILSLPPPTTTPTQAPSTMSMDIPDQIRKLAQLREEGLLSAQEFEAKKAELLSRM